MKIDRNRLRQTARTELLRRRSPRKRAYLPSPTAVRELVSLPPRELARLANPTRLKHIGRFDDDERLIGLLMIRNEADILETTLEAATPFFDRILVLDGSDDGPEREATAAILARFDEVKAVFHDSDVPTGQPVRDGARQLLLDETRRRWGVDNWIGVLHGDEIHVQDPRPVLASLNPVLNPCVRVRTAHFFLHPDDELARPGASGEGPGLHHYMFPGVPETRYFFDSGWRDFEWTLHSKVVPRSLRSGPLIDGLVMPHLNFRSDDQIQKRAADRITSGWQEAHYGPVAERGQTRFTSLTIEGYDSFDAEHADPVHGPARVLTTSRAPLRPQSRLRPVIIGGTGRCGSTMLKELLGTHPELVAFPFELKMLSWPGGLADLVANPSRRRALRLRARLLDHRPTTAPEYADPRSTNWGFRATAAGGEFATYDEAARLVCRVLGSTRTTRQQRANAARHFVGLLVANLEHQAGNSGKSLDGLRGWVEQTPANVNNIAKLAPLLDDGVFINIVRDPVDVATSLLSMPWGPESPDEAITHINETHAAWDSFVGAQTGSEQATTFTIRLEDLLADPAHVLAPILETIGVSTGWAPTIPAPERVPTSSAGQPGRQYLADRLSPVRARYGYA